MNIQYVSDRTIFETIVGSRAYGINNDNSDYDKSGVMIPGLEYFYGLNRFDQFQGYPDEDKTIYDIRKALRLISDNNPNMMDLLWVPDRCIITMTPYWDIFREHKELFVSKRCRYTFSGYAIAQLDRIKTHRKFLLAPPKEPHSRTEFGLPETPIFPTSQLKAVCYAAMQFLIEEEKQDFVDELDGIYGDYIVPLLARFLIPEERGIAMEWLQMGIKSQAKAFMMLGTQYIKDEYIDQAHKELQHYTACREYERYMSWKKSRNKERAPLEEKFGYDCYSEDTEFLTEDGWKIYDNIGITDRLATIRLENDKRYKMSSKVLIGKNYRSDHYTKILGLEYQPYLDRYEGSYTGDMYHFFGNHLDTLVTPNHRMLFRPVEKNNRKHGPIVLEEAATLPNCFDFLRHITPNTRVFRNPPEILEIPIKIEQYMTLMGWYLSEGSIGKKKGKVKDVRISQKENGRLHWRMSRFSKKSKLACSIYVYTKKPNRFNPKPIKEIILSVRDKFIANKLYTECGDAKSKRLPRWIFKTSKRLKEILFDAMVLGDGTIRNTTLQSIIYYTSLKPLADDVQELALSCGWETSLYGPYLDESSGKKVIMYQVHVNKNTNQFDRLIRNRNLEKIKVTNERIVCFTVLNGTLVTRRHGHISFHGNSKHAGHLVRLMRMGEEILRTGVVNVDRTNIDAEELKAIRAGSWTYEQIEEYAHAKDKEFDALYKSTTLNRAVDMEKINQLCISVVDCYHKGIAPK